MSGISFGRYFNIEGRRASVPAEGDTSVLYLPDTAPAVLPTSASITGDVGVTLRYPGTPTASGKLTVTGSCSTMLPVSVTLNYGALDLQADGSWTYTLDTSNPQVQQLLEDVSLLDAYPVWAADGTAGVTLTATIWGRQVVITGTTSTSVRLGSTETGGGQLTVTGGGGLLTPINRALTYGTMTVTAAGAWTYTLDPTNPAVLALGPSDHVSDSLTVRTQDGRGSVTLQAQVWGKVSVVITGTTTATLRLGGVQTGGGGLTVTGGSGKMASGSHVLTYGTMTLTDAAWSYVLDPSNPTLQGLTPQQSVTDPYTAWSSDGGGSIGLTPTLYGRGADPYSSSVVLLMQADASSVWDATGRHTLTLHAPAFLAADGVHFVSTPGSEVVAPASADFALGETGTFEMFLTNGDGTGAPYVFFCISEGQGSGYKKIYLQGYLDQLYLDVAGPSDLSGTRIFGGVGSLPNWGNTAHIEIGFTAGTWYAFIAGQLVATASYSHGWPDVGQPLIIGEMREGSFTPRYPTYGKSSGVRLTKGVCRHTASFTPPTHFDYP